MSKQLIVDYIPLDYNPVLIREAAQSNAPLRIKATLQRANAKNQNGRVYPRDILMREAGVYANEFVKQRRALGELDHPDSTVVNLKNVCLNVTEMHWEGDDLIGTLEILSTPSGNIVKELMRNGIRLGVSSRGIGSIKPSMNEVDTVEVDEDFKLIAFDCVSNPSTQGAYLNENIQHSIEENQIHRVNELIVDFLSEIGQ
jgi:hypothetical protein